MNTSAPLPSSPYVAPTDELLLALDVAGLDQLLTLESFAHVDRDTVASVISEFAKLAADVIAPSDRVSDVVGAHYDAGTRRVTTPPEFHRAYARYVDGEWGSLPVEMAHGGGGFPSVVTAALQEMFATANISLALNPVLTQGAIEALLQWGTEEQRALYLAKLMTGAWSGTMNLTEPQAGSDLGEIHTMATPRPDGTWAITGTKIFITWGEHDLTDNIIHLVLARTPDAAPGTKGLSLFLVPKVLVNPDGSLGEPNSLYAQSIEHKMGIHGSPTCVMQFENATGFLIGPLHAGMKGMFTMMNAARLAIGIQGPAIAERAYQHAYDYAVTREQGRAPGASATSPIIAHPDVQRMLLLMSTTTIAARCLIFTATANKDRAIHSDGADHERAQQLVDLLTPVAKAWSTDRGVEAASLGIQIFGGMGFIEETGIAQRWRDARIAPIYEGTNGIQAIDLVFRKIPRDNGRWVQELATEIRETLARASEGTLADDATYVRHALEHLEDTTSWMIDAVSSHGDDALAGATGYLELFGNVVAGWLMIKRAMRARELGLADVARYEQESQFFAVEVVTKCGGLVTMIMAGAARLGALRLPA
jgi:3-(methylthio)propanoyl-CoA dehydrogenase